MKTVGNFAALLPKQEAFNRAIPLKSLGISVERGGIKIVRAMGD